VPRLERFVRKTNLFLGTQLLLITHVASVNEVL
jgi:hypothetical protein